MPKVDPRMILAEFFDSRGKATPADNDDLFEKGIVDSMDLLELVAFLEERHGIAIEQEQMSADNFRSIGNIAALITRAAATP